MLPVKQTNKHYDLIYCISQSHHFEAKFKPKLTLKISLIIPFSITLFHPQYFNINMSGLFSLSLLSIELLKQKSSNPHCHSQIMLIWSTQLLCIYTWASCPSCSSKSLYMMPFAYRLMHVIQLLFIVFEH